MKITIIPSNKEETPVEGTIFDKAFDGNPAYSYSHPIEGIDITYVVFANKVVQFFNDNMTDIHGYCTTLYEVIARELFDVKGVFYCTDAPEEGIDEIGWI